MIVLGIDPSITGTALCVLESIDNKKYNIIDYRLTTQVKKIHKLDTERIRLRDKNHFHNIMGIVNQMIFLVNEYKPDRIGIEDYSFGSKGRSIFQLGEVSGCIKFVLSFNKKKFHTVNIGQWKKSIIEHGGANKSMIKEYIDNNIRDNIGNFFTFYNDNLYDSLAISIYLSKMEDTNE